MHRIKFLSVKTPKVPITRRSNAVSTDDLHELHRTPRIDAVVNNASLDLHVLDGPVMPEQLSLAPTVAFRKGQLPSRDTELEDFTDGREATSEPEKSESFTDKADAINGTDTYSSYEIVFTVMSILSYIFDVGSDIYLAFVYYNEGDIWWFTLTIIFVIVPSLVITVFSFIWYIQDTSRRPHPLIWLPRIILLFLQLGPLLRFIVLLIAMTMFPNSLGDAVCKMPYTKKYIPILCCQVR